MNCCLLNEVSLSSTSIMASDSYVNLYGVSLVVNCGVQWYPHKISGISSAQRSLAWPSFFLSSFMITLLATSA